MLLPCLNIMNMCVVCLLTEEDDVVNLLGILLSNSFCFNPQVGNVLKMCSQRVYLLKVLREQGLSHGQLHTVFLALMVS